MSEIFRVSRRRHAEVICPECGGSAPTKGCTILVMLDGVRLVYKQRRTCSDCQHKFITYKDPETLEIFDTDRKLISIAKANYHFMTNKHDKNEDK